MKKALNMLRAFVYMVPKERLELSQGVTSADFESVRHSVIC